MITLYYEWQPHSWQLLQPLLHLVQAKYYSSFQLMHMLCEESIESVSNGGQRKDKLLQHSQLRQHGEFWHVSISEQQQSQLLCGQDLCGHLVRVVLATKVEGSARVMVTSTCISTTEESFGTKAIRLGHCMIAIMTVVVIMRHIFPLTRV